MEGASKDCTATHKDLATLRNACLKYHRQTQPITKTQTHNTDSEETEINQTYVRRLTLVPCWRGGVDGQTKKAMHEERETTYRSSLVLPNLYADQRNANGRNVQNMSDVDVAHVYDFLYILPLLLQSWFQCSLSSDLHTNVGASTSAGNPVSSVCCRFLCRLILSSARTPILVLRLLRLS
jgi:hypothetical protein